MCYGFMFHHGTPPVICPPQVTISGVLLISFLLFPLSSQSAAVLFFPHHLLVGMHQLLIPDQEA